MTTCKECFYFRSLANKPGKGGCWVNPPAVFPVMTQGLGGAQLDIASVRPAEVGEADPSCKEFRPVSMQ
jgi:hypothetical protein